MQFICRKMVLLFFNLLALSILSEVNPVQSCSLYSNNSKRPKSINPGPPGQNAQQNQYVTSSGQLGGISKGTGIESMTTNQRPGSRASTPGSDSKRKCFEKFKSLISRLKSPNQKLDKKCCQEIMEKVKCCENCRKRIKRSPSCNPFSRRPKTKYKSLPDPPPRREQGGFNDPSYEKGRRSRDYPPSRMPGTSGEYPPARFNGRPPDFPYRMNDRNRSELLKDPKKRAFAMAGLAAGAHARQGPRNHGGSVMYVGNDGYSSDDQGAFGLFPSPGSGLPDLQSGDNPAAGIAQEALNQVVTCDCECGQLFQEAATGCLKTLCDFVWNVVSCGCCCDEGCVDDECAGELCKCCFEMVLDCIKCN